jgi:protoheme IX farnesyltransferase
VPALLLSLPEWPSPLATAAVLGGLALAAGSANALNSFLERDRDAHMERTALRPLPSGRLAPERALVFGLALGVLGPGLLWATAGAMAALVALAGILFYVFVYTLWLKPRTAAAVVVGGVSGAISPLVADAAFDGVIGAAGWLLFALIFVWQPPHFWAIALYRRQEYGAAGFPVLPNTRGERATRLRILAWIPPVVLVSLLPVYLEMLGPIYAVAAVGLGALFAASGISLMVRASAAAARRVFRVSLVYLMGVFVAMLGDLLWRAL